MASTKVPTSIGDKLLASAVPAPAFRTTTGAATNAKAESTQTIVYRGSRSGGDRCCPQRCYVRPWFATDVDAETNRRDNTPRKPIHAGVSLSAHLRRHLNL